MKSEMLLAYCTDLSYYLLHKVSESSLRDHEVLDRLYELRLVFEKTRLVESKLRQQLNNVLSVATASAEDRAKAVLRPNPAALVAPDTLGELKARGVYQPPKVAAVPYANEESGNQEAASRARTTRTRRAEIMEVLREHDDYHPEQKGSAGTGAEAMGAAGKRAARRERLMREERERNKFEEARFTRIDYGKKAKKRRKMNPFATSVEDIV